MTLAVDWYDDAGLPAAWLSVDRLDLDPLTLLSNLVGAVRVAFPGTLNELYERLHGGAEPPQATALIGQFVANVHHEIDDMFLLIVDDLQVLDEAPGTLELLDALVRGMPMNMRLYALSRTWPRLPSLTRMTAQRRASSLGAADLEFTDDEAVEFMRRSGIDGAPGLEVVQRAGGWAAALAILADHYDPSRPRGGTAPGSEFVLSDFVEHEVLGQLPAPQFELLSACSVLESFDAEQAEELTADPEARMHLRDLESTNHLITSLDDRWLRMHSLLREHLLERLARRDPQRLLQLRRSAAAMCARRGQRREAVNLSIEAEDWPEVVQEIRDMHRELYQRGEWTTLSGWLDRLSPEILAGDTDLTMTRARLATKMLKEQQGLAQLDSIDEQGLSVDQRARRELYRAVSLRQVGQLSEAIGACRRARLTAGEELPDDDPLFPEIDLEEGIALGQSGQFEASCERFRSAAEGFDRDGDHHRAAEAHDGFGLSLFYRGSLTRSMEEYTAALRRWRMLDDPAAQTATMNNLGDGQHMLGELETAHDTFADVIERSREIGFRRGQAYEIDDPMLVAYATLGLAMSNRGRGEFARAHTPLEHVLRQAEQRGALFLQLGFRIGVGATLVSEHRYDEAITALELAVSEAVEAGTLRE